MKLLLTSCGITNKSIENELRRILGTDNFQGIKLLYCTTASNYDGGNMDWVIENLNILARLGFEIDICDFNGISKDMIIKRLENVKVLFFEGGNTQWLYHCFDDKNIKETLYEMLKTKIWVGASAGSCVLCPTLANSVQDLFDETIEGFSKKGLGFVDFQFVPHLNSGFFEKIRIENILQEKGKLSDADGKNIYVVDDAGAVSVMDDKISVVGEGEYHIL